MQPIRIFHLTLGLLGAAVVLASCSGAAPEPEGPAAVDLVYASPVQADEPDWLLDVYAPASPAVGGARLA